MGGSSTIADVFPPLCGVLGSPNRRRGKVGIHSTPEQAGVYCVDL